MKRITRDKARAYVFDRGLYPQIQVMVGEKFLVETEDAGQVIFDC